MTRKWLDKTTALILCSALALAACGGDDDDAAPTEPEPTAEITPEIIALYDTIITSFQDVFFAALVGTTSMDGEGGGSLEISGTQWTLQDYSPDGDLIFNGVLNVNLLQTPVQLTGGIDISGAQEAELELDIEIEVAGENLAATGTVIIDGVEFDAEELSDAVAESGGE